MTDLLADLDDVRAALDARMAQHRADLEALVAIPGVSADPGAVDAVRRSAEAVRDLLAARGFSDARLLEVPGAHPAAYAERRSTDAGAPTVLLYAHHDVQPPGDPAAWTSPPFSPTERDGRLHGRGAADDKAGVLAHVAAVDAWLQARGDVPVHVKVLVEGEEESGSDHLADLLAAAGDVLRADVVVVTDSVNWRVGVPAITTTLRGAVGCDVTVRALDHALHSGIYGGPVPDPLTALAKLLAGLTDDHGAVAVAGLRDEVPVPSAEARERITALDFDEDRFRQEAGLLDGVPLAGDPSLHPLERLWLQPSITVIALDAPPVATASNTIAPAARARVSMRLAPGQDPERALDLLREHLSREAPLGLRAEVTPYGAAAGFVCDPSTEPDRSAFEAASTALQAAYGAPAVAIGVGGSIPFVKVIASALAADDGTPPAVLLLGVEDPDSRAHGIDESLHLADWRNACLGGAYLLALLGQPAGGPP